MTAQTSEGKLHSLMHDLMRNDMSWHKMIADLLGNNQDFGFSYLLLAVAGLKRVTLRQLI